MPGLITTIALNPAIDRTVLIPGFAAGITNRVVEARRDPGGKGINVARVVKALGAGVQVLGFLGESNGDDMIRALSGRDIQADFIRVAGETRVNMKIIDPDSRVLTEINDAGFAVAPEHVAMLIDKVRHRLAETAVLVLAGSLPAGVPVTIYRTLIELANAAGVPTILDADGEALARALPARPTAVKPNQAEAERLLGRPLDIRADLVRAAGEIRATGPSIVVLSSGAEGAGLVSSVGNWWATPPAIQPGSTVGAGDSMVAGLALALARGQALPEALRLATAAGAATAQLDGTQVCDAADVARLLPEVTITPITADGGEIHP
jgi:1-phosphofructokinase